MSGRVGGVGGREMSVAMVAYVVYVGGKETKRIYVGFVLISTGCVLAAVATTRSLLELTSLWEMTTSYLSGSCDCIQCFG